MFLQLFYSMNMIGLSATQEEKSRQMSKVFCVLWREGGMPVSGNWVAGDCRKGKQAPQDQSSVQLVASRLANECPPKRLGVLAHYRGYTLFVFLAEHRGGVHGRQRHYTTMPTAFHAQPAHTPRATADVQRASTDMGILRASTECRGM